MTWGAIGGAAVGVVGNALMSDSGGGGGGQAQTTSKEPWMMAQPWIMNNMVQGQNLQNRYAANPFNAQQQQAYQNQANQSAYMRAAVPSLLRQIQGQQVGFDRSNPNARPNAFSFDGLLAAAKDGQAGAAAQQGGLLDMLNGGGAVNSSLTPLAEAPKKEEDKQLIQQDMGYTPQQQRLLDAGLNPYMMGYTQTVQSGINGGLGNGRYGSYTYGQQVQPGTPAYRDMMEYFMMGGNDPWNLAPGGLGTKRLGPYADQNAGTNNGDGVSSSSTGNDY